MPMTKNTKIALGCGGAGCLGLILIVIIAAVLVAAGYINAPGIYSANSNNRNYNYNYNSNRNSNYNTNNSNTNSSSSSSSMSNDDKHKLFQAAGATKDNQLILRALAKIGFPNGTGDGYAEFLKEHPMWALRNLDFMESVNTAEKGRAYAEAHLDD